ncbi:hypothetical protein PINS_up013512 [Pythium insidiosum]|nr:hypothetical protein PINS_up013512 [Pythium insidiosum]
MDAEEAALRAKIQAMKNLLQVNSQHSHVAPRPRYPAAPQAFAKTLYRPTYRRSTATSSNRVWTRSPSTIASNTATITSVPSANKVWVNENAAKPSRPVPPLVVARPMKPQHAGTQMLKLEDGHYAKVKGGFSLVRSGVIKRPKPVSSMALSKPKPAITIQSSIAQRAQAVMNRARATRGKATVRTEYCRFYNKFGYCNRSNECKFIHDSRRIVLCRKFIRGECEDSDCKLSHDKSKMPVCAMFLRGSCHREDCRYRHVKVSGSAQICAAFTAGYCPQGESCPLRHELARRPKKRALTVLSANGLNGAEAKKPKLASPSSSGKCTNPSHTSSADKEAPSLPMLERKPSSSASQEAAESGVKAAEAEPAQTKPATPLSLRPNIRFAPRIRSNLPSLSELRRPPVASSKSVG